MLNSIFIAADPPKPPTGGGLRTLNFALALSAKSKCNLFILYPVNKEELTSQLVKQCSKIRTSNVSFSCLQKGRIATLINYVRWLVAPWSFPKSDLVLFADYLVSNAYSGDNKIADFYFFFLKYVLSGYAFLLYSLGYNKPARSLERLKQFNDMKGDIYHQFKFNDLIWIDFSTLFPFFVNLNNDFKKLKIICNSHNIEYKVLERMELLAKDKLERIWCRKQASVMKKNELDGYSKCDLIMTCSKQDKDEILHHLPNANVEVFPNGVDTEYFNPNPCLTEYPSLLFTGTMGYRPSKDAVEYFIEKIFPYVLAINPDCKFIVAGANAGEVFSHYKDRNDIEIISSPPDMRPAYNKAWIVVVPLRVGGGTRLKILEAMSMGKPVVSTIIGVEGIEVFNNKHLLVADNEIDFANKINKLIGDDFMRKKLSNDAKIKIGEMYDWNTIRESVGKAINNLQ